MSGYGHFVQGQLRETPHRADAYTGIGAQKPLEILVTVSNKPLKTVDLRDINENTGEETFFDCWPDGVFYERIVNEAQPT